METDRVANAKRGDYSSAAGAASSAAAAGVFTALASTFLAFSPATTFLPPYLPPLVLICSSKQRRWETWAGGKEGAGCMRQYLKKGLTTKGGKPCQERRETKKEKKRKAKGWEGS